MTREDDGHFESTAKCWIKDNTFVEDNIKSKRSFSCRWKIKRRCA